ncbi:carbon-nitrogen hydrolase family protein [Catenovulum sp. 2E275]|uniref:carbon-nitrogen hydrolase family protein n=1 Tax=Catenovulum sp. 2E275 TaxID=2980497 RepID=UPI0021D25551|nr:carbon-nitrogen hydrolase family protein [Catenovulum sp. 2E275]MCU4676578.1 carbon-nitrogen hydrolase family protein [Catenovulum sp. 2E275]
MDISVTSIQMNSKVSVEDNLLWLSQQFSQIKAQGHKLVVLPECFASFGGFTGAMGQIAEDYGNGPIQNFLAHNAKKYDLWLVAGSMPIKNPQTQLYSAACLLFSPDGHIQARYNKIHLFDADVADKTGQYRESDNTLAGDKVVVVDTPFAKVGLAICYDVRFPELFRLMQLQGADIICIPSAFTYVTGCAHWQTLMRARAIENQCFVVAANQTGEHQNGRHTFGHSMLIDPWGEIIHQHAEQAGIMESQIHLSKVTQTRAKMPNLQHRKFK